MEISRWTWQELLLKETSAGRSELAELLRAAQSRENYSGTRTGTETAKIISHLSKSYPGNEEITQLLDHPAGGVRVEEIVTRAKSARGRAEIGRAARETADAVLSSR